MGKKTRSHCSNSTEMRALALALVQKDILQQVPAVAALWADMWEYDEATEVWTQKSSMCRGGGRVFATGHFNQ